MELKEFTLKSKFTFEVTEDIMKVSSFKEGLEQGHIKIIQSRIELTEPGGNQLTDELVLDEIKNAIIYGLKEKA